MKTETKTAFLAIVLASGLCGGAVASATDTTVTAEIIGRAMKDRQTELDSMSRCQNIIDEEVSRFISKVKNERLEYFSNFYDSKVENLRGKDKSQDAVLVQAIIDFLTEHPRDEKTPYGLLKLAQIYIEEAETNYRSELDRYTNLSEDDRKKSSEPKKDYSYAVRPLEKIRSSFKNFEYMDACLYLLGYVYLNSSKVQDAWAIYEALAKNYPKSQYAPEAFFRTGEFYFSTKNFAKAQEAYNETIKLKDDTFYDKAVYKLAWAQYLSGQYGQATDNFMLLLDYMPAGDTADPILEDLKKDAGMYIAFSLYKKGNLASAINFIDAIKDKPYSYTIYKNLGDIYLDRGLFDNALSVYHSNLAAHPLRPENPSIHKSILALIEKDSSMSRAVTEREAIVESYLPDSAWRKANGQNQAMKDADILLEDSLYWLGITYDREGRDNKNPQSLEKAMTAYTRLVDLFPRGEKAYNAQFYLGEAHLWFGDTRNALAMYDATLKNNFFSRYYTEALYSEIVVWEKLLDEKGGLDNYDPTIFKTRQETDTSIPSKILSICNEFIDKAPKDPRIPGILYRSSEILEKLGRRDEAIARYTTVTNDYKDSPFAKDALRKILNMHVAASEWDLASARGKEFLAAPFSNDPKLKDDVRQAVALSGYKIAKNYEKEGKNAQAADMLASVASDFQDTVVFQASLNDAFVNYQHSSDHVGAKRGMIALTNAYPQNSLAPTITLEIADRERDSLRFDSALIYYSSIMEKWPKSREAEDSVLRKALIYEMLGENVKASDLYQTYAKRTPDSDLGRETFLKSLILLNDAKELEKLYKARPVAETVFAKDSAKLAITHLLIANLNFGKSDARFAESFAKGESLYKKCQKPDEYLSDLYFKLKLETIQPEISKFLKIKLAFPRKNFLAAFEKKALAVSNLEKRLTEPINRSSDDVTAHAIYNLGLIYENFGDGIIKVDLPETYSQEDKKLTMDELNRIGDPLLKKARAAHLKNVSLAKERKYFNEWVKLSLERLSTMLGSGTALIGLSLDYKYSFPLDFYYNPGFNSAPDGETDKNSRSLREALFLFSKKDASAEDLKRGLSLFDDAYDLDPTLKEARFNKAVLLRRLERLDVSEFIYTSLKNDPKIGELARLNLAEIYATRKEYDRALKIYLDYLGKNPNDSEITSNLAVIYRLTGDLDKSMNLSLGILESSPFDPRAYDNIATVYFQKGKASTATAILKKALDKNPKSILLMNSLSSIYLAGQEYEDAYLAISKAKVENPYDKIANLNYVYLLLRTQNYEDALDLAKKLWASQVAYDPDLYLNIGLTYMALDMKKEAIEHYNSNLRFAGQFRQEAKGMISELKNDETK